MIIFREITPSDDLPLAKIIRDNLKANQLDIPGTVYFDSNLDHLSDYYLNEEHAFYYILTNEDTVVGGVGLAKLDDIEDCCELQKLYLDDCMKGKGYGIALIEHIELKAKEMGYKKMYLETHTNLNVAINLYKKMGYQQINRPSFVNHSTMNVFLIKDLK